MSHLTQYDSGYQTLLERLKSKYNMEKELKIGSVITNGINHWMVWSINTINGCKNCGHNLKTKARVVPVLINQGEISHICFDWRGEYWFNKDITSIKPRWWVTEILLTSSQSN